MGDARAQGAAAARARDAAAGVRRSGRDPRAHRAAQLARYVPAAIAAAALAPVDDGRARAQRRAGSTIRRITSSPGTTRDYPRALLDIGHAPPVLFFIGRRELLNRPALAIVGSRHATPQGQANAREFAQALAAAGLTIVSGLALGIDAAAHEGALDDRSIDARRHRHGARPRLSGAQPRSRAAYRRRGGIVSEFLPGTPPRKENFPRRNRLISGLARGVLVVEATLSSGSLITARLGGRAGPRSVRDSRLDPFAVREGLSQADSRRREARRNRAGRARRARYRHGAPPFRRAAYSECADRGARLAAGAMGHDPVTIDTLVERTGAPADAIAAGLVRLELDDVVCALPGGYWQRQ